MKRFIKELSLMSIYVIIPLITNLLYLPYKCIYATSCSYNGLNFGDSSFSVFDSFIIIALLVIPTAQCVWLFMLLGEIYDGIGNDILLRHRRFNLIRIIRLDILFIVTLIPIFLVYSGLFHKSAGNYVIGEIFRDIIMVFLISGLFYLLIVIFRNPMVAGVVCFMYIAFNIFLDSSIRILDKLKYYRGSLVTVKMLCKEYWLIMFFAVVLHGVAYYLDQKSAR